MAKSPGLASGSAPRDTTGVRAASELDMAAVRGSYSHYVLHSLATFEATPPTLDEMLARRQASAESNLPYLVAQAGREILGFAYAAAYRPRPAYRFTIEDSVHVAEGFGGRGIGSALLGELIAAASEDLGGRWSRSSETAPIWVRSRCIGVSVSSSLEHCDRSASSTDAGSTLRSCSEVWERPGDKQSYLFSAAFGPASSDLPPRPSGRSVK